MSPVISDEILHAFVDGELDVDDSEKLIVRMREDVELTQRVCTLRSLQNMVRLAYAEPPPVAGGRVPSAAPRRQLMQRCAFGCLILVAGLSGGWALRSMESQAVAAVPVTLPGGYQTVSLTREADPNRVMLHLDSAAPERMQAALDQA
ncbi:MAG: hypothetical protein Q8K35_09755, partial [Thiobacillus sp.]|nr:hypothetical protein [Thiobacillus sp.]